MMHRNARSRASEEEALWRLFATPDHEFRTRYDATIAAIEDCFAPDEVFYAIYEELFTRPTLERIGAFFDLPVDASFASRQFNASPKRAAISVDLKAAIRAHYAPVYAFCRERFPQVAQLWDMGDPCS